MIFYFSLRARSFNVPASFSHSKKFLPFRYARHFVSSAHRLNLGRTRKKAHKSKNELNAKWKKLRVYASAFKKVKSTVNSRHKVVIIPSSRDHFGGGEIGKRSARARLLTTIINCYSRHKAGTGKRHQARTEN